MSKNKTFNFALSFSILIFAFSILLALPANAAPVCPPDSPGVCLDVDMVVKRIIALSCWIGSMAMTITVIMIVVYGIMFGLSQGDASKVTKAKESLVWGIVGAFVIFGAYVIIVSVAAFVGNTTFLLPFSC